MPIEELQVDSGELFHPSPISQDHMFIVSTVNLFMTQMGVCLIEISFKKKKRGGVFLSKYSVSLFLFTTHGWFIWNSSFHPPSKLFFTTNPDTIVIYSICKEFYLQIFMFVACSYEETKLRCWGTLLLDINTTLKRVSHSELRLNCEVEIFNYKSLLKSTW